MITVVCSIMLYVNTNSLCQSQAKLDVQGQVVSSSDSKYLVDFSEGVKKFPISGKPSDYDQIIVDKYECITKKK
jgi:hypothetical protein